MMSISEAATKYRELYETLPPTFGLDVDQQIWVDDQMILAAEGKRGEVTQEEINKQFDLDSYNETEIV